MNPSQLLLVLFAASAVTACDRPSPTVVNVPAPTPQVVPGPPGPQGATGNQGNQGNQGNDGLKGSAGAQGSTGNTGSTGSTGRTGSTGSAGRPGEGTTVIVLPPAASAPTN